MLAVIRPRTRHRRRWPLVATSVLAVAVLAAACDSGSTSSPSSSAVPASEENPNAQVEGALPDNAVADAVSKLDGLVESMMRDTGIPGMAVAVVSGGETKYAKGFGVADVTTGASVNADTVFPLASMSKSIGSTVIASQVTNKTVSWDDQVAAALPGFALADPYVTRTVTVADMYTHRSGLPDHAGDKIEDLGYPRAVVLNRLRYAPLQPFRITYDYTNFGITAGAESVANRSGRDWETLSEESIYRPLGMTRTSSRFRDFTARDNRVVGHVQVDGKWVVTFKQRDPDAQAPAGGVSSSVNDLTHWLTMLMAQGTYQGKQLVAPEALLPAITPQIVSSPSSAPDARAGFYGYGFNVSVTAGGRTQVSHSGAFGSGAATNFLVLPSADVAIVVLSNASPIGAVEAITGEFADLVQFGEVRHDWRTLYRQAFDAENQPSGSLVGKQRPANSAPAQALSSYVGTYANSMYGPAVVREQGGKLVLAMGPGGVTTHELTHWDGNTFTFTLRNENAELGSISKVTFDGPRMLIEYYDDEENDGVFTRQ
ncbi:serine hydrolase [Gordonia sp. NPDC003585]|uniref:serine hydrolase n=1 Tax=Gordonia sp. NPDC003585 TaxID=3154275 RepID=UPI0033B50CF8